MKTVQLNISDSDYAFIRTTDKQEVVYASEALQEKIAREKMGNINNLLKEGYQATAEEDLSICLDYAQSDLENL